MVQSLQIASSHVSQNSFNNSPSCSLQRLGLVTATDPIFLASSIDTTPCELVPRPLRWACVQNSQRKWQHVLHLFTGGSPLSQLSHSNLLLPESSWRETIDNKLFKKKLIGRESTSPSGICVTKKEILFGKFKSIRFSPHYFVQSQSQMVACLMVSRLICDNQITHSLTNKTNLHNWGEKWTKIT